MRQREPAKSPAAWTNTVPGPVTRCKTSVCPASSQARRRLTNATESVTDGEAARNPPRRTITSSPADSFTARIVSGTVARQADFPRSGVFG